LYFHYKSVSSIYATGLTAAGKTLMTEEVLFQIQDKFLIKYANVINFCAPVQ
jgi:hypothetical protein